MSWFWSRLNKSAAIGAKQPEDLNLGGLRVVYQPDIETFAWQYLDDMRNSRISRADLVAHLVENGFEPTVEFLWGLGIGRNEGLCPPFVSNFVVKLLEDQSPKKILNPWLSEGSLLKPICDQFPSADVIGISRDVANLSSAKCLLEDKRTKLLHSIESVSEDETFDLIVSALPFGMQPLTSATLDSVHLHDFQENLILAHALRHLSERGVGIFVVAPSFFTTRHRHRLFPQLGSLGYYVDAAFSMPAGTFKPLTGVETYVVVMRRGEVRPFFVAEVGIGAVETVLRHYKRRESARSPRLGTVVDPYTFVGLVPLLKEFEFRAAVKRSKHREVPLSSVALDFRTFQNQTAKFEPHENSLLLSQTAPFRVCVDEDEIPKSLRQWVQVLVDPTKARATVLARYLRSPVGQLALESTARGNLVPRIPSDAIGDIPILLPNPSDQREMLRLDDQLATLLIEAHQLQERLWAPNVDLKRLAATVENLNREDSFPAWLDSLPFPLASILWTYHTVKKDPLRGYLMLLHFFEALAQYLATILMSAIVRDSAVFSQVWEAVRNLMQDRFSLKSPTFGMWTGIHQSVAKQIRVDIHQDADGARYWQRMLACDDLELLKILVGKEMASLLQKATDRRNAWSGHGNAVAHNEVRHEEARKLLLQFRELVGTKWSTYSLVLPETTRKSRGRLFAETRLLMGQRTPFDSKEFLVTDNLEEGVMHLVGGDSGNICELLPFVRLGQNPRKPLDTCYFYNGLRHGEVEFKVYQSQDAETVTQTLEDFEIHLERFR